MIIDTVEISNLGLWENLFLKFDKSINIIQGENGVGKTTLLWHMKGYICLKVNKALYKF